MMKKIVYIIIVVLTLAVSARMVSSYESKGKRDPFVPLVGQDKVRTSEGLDGILSIQDVTLEGMAVGPGGKNVAILNGQMVKEGDKFGALSIKNISRKRVTISIEGKDYTLNLQEEGPKVGK